MLYHPRNKLDLDGGVITRAICYSLLPPSLLARKKLESSWAPRAQTKAFFSVRTGFDLLIRSLSEIEPGDEVMMTAITIPAMWQIVEKRGLKVVTLDIDPHALRPSVEEFEAKLTRRTKILALTHVFGTANRNDEIIAAARERGMYVIEDCAQCYHGQHYHGNPMSDVSMFSFGPLKTASTMGGALFHFSDSRRNKLLIESMVKKEKKYPRATNWWLISRALDYRVKIFLQKKFSYYVLTGVLRMFRKDIDALIVGSTRAFKQEDLLRQIRMRPPFALYTLLYWRMRSYSSSQVNEKVLNTRDYRDVAKNAETVIGHDAEYQTAWLQPFMSAQPKSTVRKLRTIGIDGSLVATALKVFPAGDTPIAKGIIDSCVYAPMQYQMSNSRRSRALKILGLIVEKKERIHDWPRIDTFAVTTVRPRNDAELSRLVLTAKTEGAVIRVIGRGKSVSQGYGSSARKTYSVSMDYFTSIEVDERKKCMIVGAGATWSGVHRVLAEHGLAPLVQQSADDFTIGGSLAAGAHGRDVSASRIIDSVIWIDAIDANGKLRRYSKAEDLEQIVGSQGLAQLIVRASLRVTNNDLYETKVKTVSYVKFFENLQHGRYLSENSLLIARPTLAPKKRFSTIQVIRWVREGERAQGQKFPIERSNIFVSMVFRLSARYVFWASLRSVLEEKLQARSHGKIVTRIDAMRPPLVPLKVLTSKHEKFFDHPQEFYVPLSRAQKFYEFLMGELGGEVITGYTLRYVHSHRARKDKKAESEVAFMLYMTTKRTDFDEVQARRRIKLIAQKCITLGGRPYLAYAKFLDDTTISAAYPALKNSPIDGVFASDLGDRLRSGKYE